MVTVMETITYRMMTWIGLGAASVAIILSVDPKVNLVGYPSTTFVSILLTVISIIRERMYIYVPVPGGQTAPRDSCGDIFRKLYLPTLIDL